MSVNSWSVPGSLTVAQNLIIGKALSVGGTAVVAPINPDWNQTDSTKLDFIKNAPPVAAISTTVNGTTTVTGAAVTGNETVSGNSTVTGNQTVSGNSIITGTLQSGNATFSGYSTTGNANVTGTFTGGSVTSTTTLTANGAFAAKAGSTVTGNESVSGNQTVGGTLQVSGLVTASGGFTATGTVTHNGPVITPNAIYGTWTFPTTACNSATVSNFPLTLTGGTGISLNANNKPIAPFTGIYHLYLNLWSSASAVSELWVRIYNSGGTATQRPITAFNYGAAIGNGRFTLTAAAVMNAGDYCEILVTTNASTNINNGEGPGFGMFLDKRLA